VRSGNLRRQALGELVRCELTAYSAAVQAMAGLGMLTLTNTLQGSGCPSWNVGRCLSSDKGRPVGAVGHHSQ